MSFVALTHQSLPSPSATSLLAEGRHASLFSPLPPVLAPSFSCASVPSSSSPLPKILTPYFSLCFVHFFFFSPQPPLLPYSFSRAPVSLLPLTQATSPSLLPPSLMHQTLFLPPTPAIIIPLLPFSLLALTPHPFHASHPGCAGHPQSLQMLSTTALVACFPNICPAIPRSGEHLVAGLHLSLSLLACKPCVPHRGLLACGCICSLSLLVRAHRVCSCVCSCVPLCGLLACMDACFPFQNGNAICGCSQSSHRPSWRTNDLSRMSQLTPPRSPSTSILLERIPKCFPALFLCKRSNRDCELISQSKFNTCINAHTQE